MNDAKPNDAAALLATYEPLAWKIARSFTSNPADCEDLLQEMFLSLWTLAEKLPQDLREREGDPPPDRKAAPHELRQQQDPLRGASALASTYVYRVLFNRAVSWRRKETTYLRHLRQLIGASRREEKPVTDAGEIAELYQAIRQLDPLDRTVVLLHLEQQSYAAMADVLGISVAAVGQRLSRARRKLAHILTSLEKP